MAEAAVVLLLKKIASILGEEALKQGFTLLCREASQLGTVHEKLNAIQDELKVIRGFLQDVHQWEESSSESALKAWVDNVRKVAREAEDIVDEVFYLLGKRRRRGFKATLHKLVHVRPWLHVLHELQGVETRLNQLCKTKEKWVDVTQKSGTPRDADKISKLVADKSRLMQEDDVVGIEDHKATLINWLVDAEPRLRLSSVWGMGGVGKTTLVSQVYRSHEVRKRFTYRAWVSVSQTYQVEDLLRNILKQLVSSMLEEGQDVDLPPEINTMTYLQLAEVFQAFLQGKTCLVVLDDVWDANAWDVISTALIENRCGSRIVFTSRLSDVAHVANEKYRIELQPLQEEDAWTLFCKKAFRDPYTSCPPELESCARRIMEKCDGLPLAIVTVGSMLSLRDQDSSEEWERAYRGLSWELNNNPQLQNVKSILNLSFKALTYLLRNCLLYCSVFPEDTPIKRKRLIRLWVAEGLVEQRGDKTMEEVAEDNLNELVHRCLLQVVNRKDCGSVKECRMHDILRDLLLSISRAEKFGIIYGNRGSSELDDDSSEGHVRLMHIHSQPSSDTIQSWQGKHMPGLRSLLVHKNIMADLIVSSVLSGWRLLRVLDLKGASIESLPTQVYSLYNLRYLSLKDTKVSRISNAIKWLINLEVLDLGHTNIQELPRGLRKLKKLRHLLVLQVMFSSERFLYVPKLIPTPRGIWNLKSLQALNGVEANEEMVSHKENLTQLTSFIVTNVKQAHCSHLCKAISKMNSLQKLKLHTSSVVGVHEEGGAELEVEGLSHPPPFLHELEFDGRLKGGALPTWFGSLHNLAYMWLTGCQLREDQDPLPSLHALPFLVSLSLADAYLGRRLCFRDGWFRKLKVLAVHSMSCTRTVEIEEGALPSLRNLFLLRCPEMKEIPRGIQHLKTIQILTVGVMPDDFLRNLQEEGDRVQHIPIIKHFFYGDDHQLHMRDPRESGGATISVQLPERGRRNY